MGYERIWPPEGPVYHYTKRENLEAILKDERLRRFGDPECWVCGSLEDTLRLMELTVMVEGKLYYGKGGIPMRYPTFVQEEYVILKIQPRYANGTWVIWNQELPEHAPKEVKQLAEEFSHIKLGYRGDLRFKNEPEVIEVSELLGQVAEEPGIQQSY